jgi:hypothetical protein
MLHASVAEVKIGNLSFPGLMDEKGVYYIGIPQVADLVKTSRNTASRDFNRLMNSDSKDSKTSIDFFETHKLKSEFNKNLWTAK